MGIAKANSIINKKMKGGEIMITYSNTSKLIFSQVQGNSTINLKPKVSQGTSDTEFKTVFDKTLNNTTKRTYVSNESQDDNKISQNSDSKVKYKSFKDIKRNSSQSSVEKTSGNAKTQKVETETQELSSDSNEYDDTINVLAQMLGLQPSELLKIANDLGFSSEDLKNVKNLSLFTDKLANVLQLNDQQKTMLSALAVEVSKQVNTESVSTSESTETVISPNEANANANTNTNTINLSKVADEVKAKLEQLIQNARTNQESIGSEVSKVIEAMKSQIQVKATIKPEQVDTKSITDVATEADAEGTSSEKQLSEDGNVSHSKESEKASNYNDEDNSKSAENSATKTEMDITKLNVQVVTGNEQNQQLDQQNLQAIGDVKIGTINNQTEVQKTVFSMPQPVKNSEVLNQVVEQAKVIVGQDKSEMVIQLKPDHLGKLELKVVTEQGIVAAKFIAESQQVKEIIETNMQLLKDSLQKQGIIIDSVNVQVGHDQHEYQQQNSYQSSNNSSSTRQKYGSSESGIATVGINALDALPERLAQYANESNTINLTA